MNASSRPQRGVSLVEALVALGVMAFGMLGLVGMQATMRMNSDIAKQRAEAVRLAQANIETGRGYDTMAAYAAVSAASGVASGANATYEWEIAMPAPQVSPGLKTIIATTKWLDRVGDEQQIRLQTYIAGTPPELGAALGVAGSGTSRKPRGRAPGIPPGAVNQGDGTSRYEPPASGNNPAVGWVFDNVTGYIIKVCNVSYESCTGVRMLPLSGYVRFSDNTPPLATDAEIPTGIAIPVKVKVDTSVPSTATVDCYFSAPTLGAVSYACAMPLTTTLPYVWSGQSIVFDDAALVAITSPYVLPAQYRVCRYTPTAATGNEAHPATYTDVAVPLANQNFLLIRAGDGTTAYTCPSNDTSTPYLDGTTVQHQPPLSP